MGIVSISNRLEKLVQSFEILPWQTHSRSIASKQMRQNEAPPLPGARLPEREQVQWECFLELNIELARCSFCLNDKGRRLNREIITTDCSAAR